MLKIRDLCKEYQDLKVVNHVSFEVRQGSICGLLGPNGAGKTSLIRMITGITRPDSGEVILDGKAIHGNGNNRIAYMPEERGLYKKMSVGEQLLYLCRLRGFDKKEAEKRVVWWMNRFEIQSWWTKKVEELSKGMSQKIQFIAAVVHDPKLIILDEPFSGLDPINSNLIRDEIIRLRNEGAAILFSTHRMEQVEELCDEIVLINKGIVLLNGEVGSVRQQFKEHLYELKCKKELPPSILDNYEISHIDHCTYKFFDPEEKKGNQILQSMIKEDIPLQSYREILPTFSEIFIKTVNQSNNE
ncbi:MAG TPA: ATP-binding cassette domain-containing protein [Saprospiraceae bacterium]|nr:ATP-binding cassette domain-containing protein [Saprospiraceae bacterium]